MLGGEAGGEGRTGRGSRREKLIARISTAEKNLKRQSVPPSLSAALLRCHLLYSIIQITVNNNQRWSEPVSPCISPFHPRIIVRPKRIIPSLSLLVQHTASAIPVEPRHS